MLEERQIGGVVLRELSRAQKRRLGPELAAHRSDLLHRRC